MVERVPVMLVRLLIEADALNDLGNIVPIERLALTHENPVNGVNDLLDPVLLFLHLLELQSERVLDVARLAGDKVVPDLLK